MCVCVCVGGGGGGGGDWRKTTRGKSRYGENTLKDEGKTRKEEGGRRGR